MSQSARVLDQLHTSLDGFLDGLSPVAADVARNEVAAWLGDCMNKAVRMAVALRNLQNKLGAPDTAPGEARRLLESPVICDFAAYDFNRFYDEPLNRVVFPALEMFFGAELAEYDETKGNPSDESRSALEAAKIVLAVLKQDPDLQFQGMLRDVFLLSIGPEDTNIRGMVLEFAELFPERARSYAESYQRLAGYWRTKLAIELGKGVPDGAQHTSAFASAFQAAVEAAVKSQSGADVEAVLNFARSLKRARIEERIAQLERESPAASGRRELEAHLSDMRQYLALLGSADRFAA